MVDHDAHRHPCGPRIRVLHPPPLATLQNASYLEMASLWSSGIDLTAQLVGRKGAPRDAEMILCFSVAAIGPIHNYTVHSGAGPRTCSMQAQQGETDGNR